MGSGSVRSIHQTVSDYTIRQWFPNTQQSRFLAACRRLEKLVLSSIFFDNVKLAELSNKRFWKKECDILGVKAYSDPSYIFSGVQDPNPQDLRPERTNQSARSVSTARVDVLTQTAAVTLLHSVVVVVVSCVGYNYNSTSIPRPFDGHSTDISSSQWRNRVTSSTLSRWPIYSGRSSAARAQVGLRNV